MAFLQQSWSGHRQFILLPVRVAGKAVIRVEKTKGTKAIGKIKLTPVTLSLCNWRNLNWISLTERCWHWEIAQTWEALAGQEKCWGEKSCPTYSLMCPPMSHSPISHCLSEIMLPLPPQRQPIWSLTVVHWGGLEFFNHVQLIHPDNALYTYLLLLQATTYNASRWSYLKQLRCHQSLHIL